MAPVRFVPLALVALAAAALQGLGARTGVLPGSALVPRPARSPRARPRCLIDVAECFKTVMNSGAVSCITESAQSSDVTTSKAVVDDVVAGLTGGFVGVAGTVVSLELRKQAVKEKLKCEYCRGEGMLTCGACYGAGCDVCAGTGKVKCVSCGGSGRAVSTEVEKQQFRAIFGLFPEMRYGPESTMFDDRDGPDWGNFVETPTQPADTAKAVAPGATAGAREGEVGALHTRQVVQEGAPNMDKTHGDGESRS